MLILSLLYNEDYCEKISFITVTSLSPDSEIKITFNFELHIITNFKFMNECV